MQHFIKSLKTGYSIKHLFYCLIVFLLCNNTYAASQGKLGYQSTANVEISVTINQSLNAISPNEILLNNSNNLTTRKPFCIANNGYEKNVSVPYNLIVDRLETSSNDMEKLPFNIYLEDENNKRLLSSGTKISTQSKLKTNQDIFQNCIEAGMKLSIESKAISNNTQSPNTTGLLLLLVSPY